MSVTEHMLDAHPPVERNLDLAKLRNCVDACGQCAEACNSCADACLGEVAVADLAACVRINLDCADLCEVTRKVITRQTGRDDGIVRAILETCARACEACGIECERHSAEYEHCRVCAQECRLCAQACRDLLVTV